jgi:hypothetical protein
VKYYKGLVTSGLQQDNGASSADMLKRSLQLAGERGRGGVGRSGMQLVRTEVCVSTLRCSRQQWRVCARSTGISTAVSLLNGRSSAAGGIGGLLALLTGGFMASNGLL